jgi:hypothetical protein
LNKEPEAWDHPSLKGWIGFLKAESKEEIGMIAKTDPNIEAAAKAYEEFTLSGRWRLLREARKKEKLDWYARLGGAWEEGAAKGREKGREEGIGIGEQRGVEQAASAFRALAEGKTPEEAARISGLSAESVKRLMS